MEKQTYEVTVNGRRGSDMTGILNTLKAALEKHHHTKVTIFPVEPSCGESQVASVVIEAESQGDESGGKHCISFKSPKENP